jgi:hypothetical protein
MKTGYLALLAAGASTLAGAAFAQAPQRWTDPTGAWSIEYVSVGWGTSDGLPKGGPTTLMTMPVKPPADNEVRICVAEQAVLKSPAAKDAMRFAQGLSAPMLQKAFPRMEFGNAKVSHIDIDGVAVVDIDGKAGTNRMRTRFFFTPYQDGAVQTKLACVLDPNLRADLAAEVEAVLGSLKFNVKAPS